MCFCRKKRSILAKYLNIHVQLCTVTFTTSQWKSKPWHSEDEELSSPSLPFQEKKEKQQSLKKRREEKDVNSSKEPNTCSELEKRPTISFI